MDKSRAVRRTKRLQMRKIALIFLIFGISLVRLGSNLSWGGLLPIWGGLSFLAVSGSYAINRPWIFGKSAQGDRALWSSLILMPYLGLTWLMWWMFRKTDAAPCCHQITDNIWLGRRPIVAELPNSIDLVVDLTCEFTPQSLLRNRYLSLPILDHAIPRFDEFDGFVQRLAQFPGRLYVHCAAGRSRSAMVVAAILLANGVCQTPQAAIAYVHRRRSCVQLTQNQENFLTEWYDRRNIA
jgi:protein-tyrosine phosphatase